MGMLDQALNDGGDSPAAEPDTGAADGGADETVAVPEPEKKEHVALPTGRRGRAAARAGNEALDKVAALEQTWTKEKDDFRRELATRDTEIARLRGGFEALQPILQQRQAPQPPAPPPPDPSAIRREARAALDAGRYDDYERLSAHATRIEAKAEVFKELEERGVFQDRGPARSGVDPRLQIIMNQHPRVALAPNGQELAIAKDMELAALGQQNGPERWKRAYEMAEAMIGGQATTSREFSQQGAGAMAGIPTGRNTAGTGAARPRGVELSDLEKDWARRGGMSYEEYAEELAKAHPERIV